MACKKPAGDEQATVDEDGKRFRKTAILGLEDVLIKVQIQMKSSKRARGAGAKVERYTQRRWRYVGESVEMDGGDKE